MTARRKDENDFDDSGPLPPPPPLTPGPPPPPVGSDDATPREAAIHQLDTFLLAPSDERIPIAGEAQRRRQEDAAWEGRQLGSFTVTRRLAKGGMGVVLMATDQVLRRTVALKVMDSTLREDADAVRRFEREARATAAVQHPHIAAVHAVGVSDDGYPYLVMEYVDGGSLMDRIRARTPMAFSTIAMLMEQVASALQAAQRVNIIHRDIKPANVMLTAGGDAKVVDFGLAKIFFEDSYRTEAGMVLGTPSYMAPEQSQGRVVDHRADIYSLGATFYHAIAGRPPFIADSPVQIMMKHVTAPLVPMRSLNPTVPMEFDDIIGRCMRKDIDERYQDYETLLLDIRRVRLMCATREHGAVLGSTGSAVPPPAAPVAGAASSILPPPRALPRQPASLASAVGPAPQGPAGLPAPPPPEDSGLTTGRMVAMAVAGVVIVLALMTVVLREDAPKENHPPRRAPRIGNAIDTAARQAADGSDDIPLTPMEAYTATVGVLQSLQSGLVKYELEEGRLPASLPGAIDESRFVITFTSDADGNPLDGWGNAVLYDQAGRRLRSLGLDGRDATGDEIEIDFDGNLRIPEAYRRLR